MAENVSGTGNVAVGSFALTASPYGSYNVAIGSSALTALNSGGGVDNTAVGAFSLSNLTNGSDNVCIGVNSGGNYVGNESGNICLFVAGNAGDNQTIRIGSDGPTRTGAYLSCYLGGVYNAAALPIGTPSVAINSSEKLGIPSCSRRFKDKIAPLDQDIVDKIYQLEPKSFVYKSQPEEVAYGLIAEEVDEILPALVIRDPNGVPFTLAFNVIPSLILAAVQQQKKTIDEQKDLINQLLQRVTTLEQLIKK